MSDWSEYVEWSGLDEAKLRHPAGKGLESAEVQAAMDDEACRLGSSNWGYDTTGSVWPVVGIVLVFALIVCVPAVVADLIAGWQS